MGESEGSLSSEQLVNERLSSVFRRIIGNDATIVPHDGSPILESEDSVDWEDPSISLYGIYFPPWNAPYFGRRAFPMINVDRKKYLIQPIEQLLDENDMYLTGIGWYEIVEGNSGLLTIRMPSSVGRTFTVVGGVRAYYMKDLPAALIGYRVGEAVNRDPYFRKSKTVYAPQIPVALSGTVWDPKAKFEPSTSGRYRPADQLAIAHGLASCLEWSLSLEAMSTDLSNE